MYRLSLKIALRNLWKNIGFSLINIGGLAIGLTSCLLLLLYVYYEWSFDKQFKSADRIYAVYDHSRMSDQINTSRVSNTPDQLAATAKQTIPGIEYITRLVEQSNNFNYKQNSFLKTVIYADPAYLQMFDYEFIKGDPATAMLNPNSMVLTEKTAVSIFGKEDAIGKIIKFDNQHNLVVTAIIKDLPPNQTYQFDILLTWSFLTSVTSNYSHMNWNDSSLSTLIQLKDNNSFPAADAQMRNIFKQNYVKDDFKTFFLFPFEQVHLHDNFENGKLAGGKIEQVRLYLLLAMCILFIACINYMNLSTARSEKRAREVGVRKTLGSSRGSLAWQFLLESVLLSFIAMFFAVILLEIVLPYFNQLLEIQMTINYASYEIWAVVVSLVLITGLLAGSYPSFYLSSFMPVKVLKGFKGAENGSLPMRKVLVITQFSFSICMIIFGIMVYNQIQYMKNKPLGFDQNDLVQVPRIGRLTDYKKFKLLKNQLLESAAVVAVTANSSGLTTTSLSTEAIRWPGQQTKEQVEIQMRFLDYDFTKTIGVSMVEGRDFNPKYGTDTMGVILNETAVKTMNLKNPIGKQITNDDWGQTMTVIGVMKDYNYLSLGKKVGPVLFFLNEEHAYTLVMRLNPAENIQASLQKIKDLTTKANPGYPFDLSFVSDKLVEKLKNEQRLSVLANVFGGFAIFISCLGLLGLALYMAEQRSKEISIRKVLGADMRSILILLNKDFMKLVLISNLIACPLAYIIGYKWLEQFDYRAEITLWPMVATISLSILVALLTVSAQSFKVARANPVDALKYE